MKIENMFSKARECNELFDGIKCKCGVDYTIVRGRVVFEDGKVDDEAKGYGEYVARHAK